MARRRDTCADLPQAVREGTGVCREFAPSYPADTPEEYAQAVEEGHKRFAHAMLAGGRQRFAGQESEARYGKHPEQIEEVSDATRERLASLSPPFSARTQSLASHAYAQAPRSGRSAQRDQREQQRELTSAEVKAALQRLLLTRAQAEVARLERERGRPFPATERRAHLQWAAQQMPGLLLPTQVQPLLEAGMPPAAAQYLVSVAGGRLVLRSPPEGAVAPSLQQIIERLLGMRLVVLDSPLLGDARVGLDLAQVPLSSIASSLRPLVRQVLSHSREGRGRDALRIARVTLQYPDAEEPLSFARIARQAGWQRGLDAEEYAAYLHRYLPTFVDNLQRLVQDEDLQGLTLTIDAPETELSPVVVSLPLRGEHSVLRRLEKKRRPIDYSTLRDVYLTDLPAAVAHALHRRPYRRRQRRLKVLENPLAQINPLPTYVLDSAQYADLPSGSATALVGHPGQYVYKNARGELRVVSEGKLKSWATVVQRAQELRALAKQTKSNPSSERKKIMARSRTYRNPAGFDPLEALAAELCLPAPRPELAPARRGSYNVRTESRSAPEFAPARRGSYKPRVESRPVDTLEGAYGPKARLGADIVRGVVPEDLWGNDQYEQVWGPVGARRSRPVNQRNNPRSRRNPDDLEGTYGKRARLGADIERGVPMEDLWGDDQYEIIAGAVGARMSRPVNQRNNPRHYSGLALENGKRRRKAKKARKPNLAARQAMAAAKAIFESQGCSWSKALSAGWQQVRAAGARPVDADPVRANGRHARHNPASNAAAAKAIFLANPNPRAKPVMRKIEAQGYATRRDLRKIDDLCG